MAKINIYDNINKTQGFTTTFGAPNDLVLINVYDTNDNYVDTINVGAEHWFLKTTNKEGATVGGMAATGLYIEDIMKANGFFNGLYKLSINFTRPILSNFPSPTISDDRTEIKLDLEEVWDDSPKAVTAFTNIYRDPRVIHSISKSPRPHNLPMVVSVNNETFIPIINILKNNPRDLKPEKRSRELYFKLSQELPPGIDNINISMLLSDVTELYVSLISPVPQEPYNRLNPNFDMKYDDSTARSTGFKTWDDLVGGNTPTSDKIVSDIISGSFGQGAELNIDYRGYENFIHFSSAEERLRNFHYKMTLMEGYRSDNATLNSLSTISDEAEGNILLNSKKINGVLNGFDGYERHLYYDSGSFYSGSADLKYDPSTWPKYNNVKPYCNMSASTVDVKRWYGSSNISNNYFGGRLNSASLYDRHNEDLLVKALPQFILEDTINNESITFVHMLAQHYDILYNYIDHMTKINEREESTKSGAPKQMLFNIAKSLGIDLFNGNNNEDLWGYAFGTGLDGSTLQTGLGLVSGSLQSFSGKERTTEIWNRLINNIPMLLKSKGTERSIRALINSYGIPSTILRIMEFGGPEPEGQNSKLAINKAAHALKFSGEDRINHDWVSINKNTPRFIAAFPQTVEMRIKTTKKQNQVLWGSRTSLRGLMLEHSSSTHLNYSAGTSPYGRLKFFVSGSHLHNGLGGIITGSTGWAPIFDGDWWNVMLRRTEVTGSSIAGQKLQPVQYDAYAAKAADHSYGTITHKVSGSSRIVSGGIGKNGWINALTSNMDIGSRPDAWDTNTDVPADIKLSWPADQGFIGSMQEFRLWRTRLNESAFDQHVQNPQCIVGNNYSSSYYDLVTRYTLGTDLLTYDHSTTTVVTSSHPQAPRVTDFSTHATSDSYATGTGFSTFGNDYENVEEVYYINMPSTVGTRGTSNKIRIEDNKIIKHPKYGKLLSAKVRKEASSFDTSPLDTNKLGIYLSPVHDINIDIANNIGQTRLDDFVGDPRDQYNDSYSELNKIRKEYFKKYTGAKGLWDFIRQVEQFDGSLFKMMGKFIPRKANETVGLLFEPSILERPKVKTNSAPILGEDIFPTATHINIDYNKKEGGTVFDTGSFGSGVSAEYLVYEGCLSGSRQWLESPYRFVVMTSSLETNFKKGSDGSPYELARIGSLLKHSLHGYHIYNNGSRYINKQLISHKGVDGYTQGSMSFQLTPVGMRNAIQPVITGSRQSQLYNKKEHFYSSSFSASKHTTFLQMNNPWSGPYTELRRMAYSSSLLYADYKDDELGTIKLSFEGTRLSGPDFNVDTGTTPDGGPVVSYFETNPNQLFVAPVRSAQFGDLLLSGDSDSMASKNRGNRIPGSVQPGPQGQVNGYWLDTGYEMQWITQGRPGRVYRPSGYKINKNNNIK